MGTVIATHVDATANCPDADLIARCVRIDEIGPGVDAAAHALRVSEAIFAQPLRRTQAAHAVMAVDDEVLLCVCEHLGCHFAKA